MSPSFEGKKIILVSYAFYEYSERIKHAIEARGAQCILINPFCGMPKTVSSVILKSKQPFEKHSAAFVDHLNKLVGAIEVDAILVINGSLVSERFSSFLKSDICKNISKVLYIWDSKNTNPDQFNEAAAFDRVFTFDPLDAAENDSLTFRPLFFVRAEKRVEEHVGCTFVGRVYADRYAFLKKLGNNLDCLGVPYMFHAYVPSYLQYLLRKYVYRELDGAKVEDFSYTQLDTQAVIDFTNSYSTMIDIEKPGQIGLTMRTIESIGLNKKLITTNDQVKNYDFFEYGNVAVVSRNNPMIDESFFKEPYHELPEELLYRYSINGFLDDVLMDL